MDRIPVLEIVEQPKQRGMRFRYECEGRSAGSIPGKNTNGDRKTWPSCQVLNYSGVAIMRVSLVSKDDPPRPHPHSLVGRDCNNGVCQINVDPGNQMLGVFPNLGIQCVRRREVSQAIQDRLNHGVNPFGTMLDGDERSAVDVDLNIVRLCFEAFIPDARGKYTQKLEPVVSDPIYDKKATCSSVLKICRVDKTHGSCMGNEEVFLLCDKVQKEDIQVVFYRDNWEALGDFSSVDVHRQVAIVFRTPPFCNENIQEKVDVQFKLRRPSDMETSKPLVFTYLPVYHEMPQKHKFPTQLLSHPIRSNNNKNGEIRKFISDRIRKSKEPAQRQMYSPNPNIAAASLNHHGMIRNPSNPTICPTAQPSTEQFTSTMNPSYQYVKREDHSSTAIFPGDPQWPDSSHSQPPFPSASSLFNDSMVQPGFGPIQNTTATPFFDANSGKFISEKSTISEVQKSELAMPTALPPADDGQTQRSYFWSDLLKQEDSIPRLDAEQTRQLLQDNVSMPDTALENISMDSMLEQWMSKKCSIEGPMSINLTDILASENLPSTNNGPTQPIENEYQQMSPYPAFSTSNTAPTTSNLLTQSMTFSQTTMPLDATSTGILSPNHTPQLFNHQQHPVMSPIHPSSHQPQQNAVNMQRMDMNLPGQQQRFHPQFSEPTPFGTNSNNNHCIEQTNPGTFALSPTQNDHNVESTIISTFLQNLETVQR
uniref:RelA n=2 Tax=Ciona intestinalis TaxID=7719 RepID=Q4H2V9_CIOIN|nr:rel1 protein isoform X1 [Ciona intestinalis]BAE06668.1 RelA [Ciona intestinalis]|eukprot:XP_026692312.1 rel1 protein isoform X1 [Ciona intestinalis]